MSWTNKTQCQQLANSETFANISCLVTNSFHTFTRHPHYSRGDQGTGEDLTLLAPGLRDELPPVISPGDWPVTEPEPGDRGQVTIGAGESGSEPPVRGRGNHSVGDWRPGGVVAGTIMLRIIQSICIHHGMNLVVGKSGNFH